MASLAALGLVWALGAGAPAAAGSDVSAAARFAACGQGYPKKPPRRYRFRLWGTTTYRFFGTETWLYQGVMKRVICRGTKVEYWQTRGRGTLTFKNIDMYPYDDCNYTGPPYTTVGNAPTQSFRLRRFDLDVSFGWIGNKYNFSTRADRNYRNVVQGTVRCPDGATFPQQFAHKWIGIISRRGRPKRIVKGFFKYQDREFYVYRINWRLRALR